MCKDKIDLYIKKNTMYNFLGEILTSDPSIYMTDHPDLTVSKFTENYIGLKRDNLFAALCLVYIIYPDCWDNFTPNLFRAGKMHSSAHHDKYLMLQDE